MWGHISPIPGFPPPQDSSPELIRFGNRQKAKKGKHSQRNTLFGMGLSTRQTPRLCKASGYEGCLLFFISRKGTTPNLGVTNVVSSNQYLVGNTGGQVKDHASPPQVVVMSDEMLLESSAFQPSHRTDSQHLQHHFSHFTFPSSRPNFIIICILRSIFVWCFGINTLGKNTELR